jgi:uncharacterized membrane-anchored protein
VDPSRVTKPLGRVPKWVWFALAILVQLVIIGALAGGNYVTLVTGRTVYLSIAPVDPRDPTSGKTVWVPLVPQEQVWVVGGPVRLDPPGTAEQRRVRSGSVVFMRGVVAQSAGAAVPGRVTYGIEQYFVREGKGNRLPWDSRSAAAEVSVGADGKAVIRRVFVNGKPFP